MKHYVTATLALLLIGCTMSNNQDEVVIEVVIEVVMEKLNENAPSLFCDQPEYSTCFGITQKQCLVELNNVAQKCIEKSKMKFSSVSSDNYKRYTKYYSSCLILEQVVKYPDRLDVIGNCLKTVDFNRKEGLRSLLK